MNRIRKFNGVYQVLITPNIKIAPDSPILIGGWDDETLRNYFVLDYPTLNEAQCEAFKYPDIDWYRIVLNHTHIYQRLKTNLEDIIERYNFTVEFIPKLMDPEEFKHAMFDRVINGGERFNLRDNFTDIISFRIVNPWTKNLFKVSKILETHSEHLYRDDLRIREKKIIDGKVICLYGITEFGTMYEIKLMPTMLHQWKEWYVKYGFNKDKAADTLYRKAIKLQDQIDKNITII